MIFTVDSSNVGEFSRTWGYILDNNYDRFFDYPTIMYIVNVCLNIPTFGMAWKIVTKPEKDEYFLSEDYKRLVTDCIRVHEWNK